MTPGCYSTGHKHMNLECRDVLKPSGAIKELKAESSRLKAKEPKAQDSLFSRFLRFAAYALRTVRVLRLRLEDIT
jgi:hypothetical protein